VALVEDVGSPALGVCLDWFHWTVGPSKPLDLGLLSRENLAHVQLSDIADVPREMAADADRILPGEGGSPCDDLVQRLREIGYTGAVAVETPNPRLWSIPPRQFGEVAFTAVRRLLGQAAG
jgi:4-hydroxyphenylpyruvate dioxygenase